MLAELVVNVAAESLQRRVLTEPFLTRVLPALFVRSAECVAESVRPHVSSTFTRAPRRRLIARRCIVLAVPEPVRHITADHARWHLGVVRRNERVAR